MPALEHATLTQHAHTAHTRPPWPGQRHGVPRDVDGTRGHVEQGQEHPRQTALERPACACKKHIVPSPCRVYAHLRTAAGSFRRVISQAVSRFSHGHSRVSPRPRLHYRLLTLCLAPTDSSPQLCAHICIYACGSLPASIHPYTYIHIHTYMHACMRACVHTYIHTYMHIRVCALRSPPCLPRPYTALLACLQPSRTHAARRAFSRRAFSLLGSCALSSRRASASKARRIQRRSMVRQRSAACRRGMQAH